MRSRIKTSIVAVAALLLGSPVALQAQRGGQQIPEEALQAGLRVASIRAEPASLSFEVGASARVALTAVDANGQEVADAIIRVGGARGLSYEDGVVTAETGGEFEIFASVVIPPGSDRDPATVRVPVHVDWPAVARIDVAQVSEGRLYAGTTVRLAASAYHGDGGMRPQPSFTWSSSDRSIATVDSRGFVTAVAPGRVTISANLEGARGGHTFDVPALPVQRIEVRTEAGETTQGDVLDVEARVVTTDGRTLTDVPVLWTTTFVPDDSIAAPGAGGIVRDGQFVGEIPGRYTLVARAGDASGSAVVDVRARDVVQPVEILGHGSVTHVHTSDLWVYEGVDGRDYAVTGTWGGNGVAYFWDVTDPTNIVKIDSIQVDARTVNDVKVSPDGRYAALSREGTSTRQNGPVLVDLSNPRDPEIATYYADGITGGVHNMFATNDYLFALSGGDKYVIIDVRDIHNPKYVSEYNHPDSRIHDVWVYDGLAFSSEWGNGVVIVDVGNGKWGGSIENPVFVANIPYPVGRTHAAFPYYQESTGKYYLFLGDEIMGRSGTAWQGAGLNRIPEPPNGTPVAYNGYIHIIDWTDPENPKDVARYQVPEFGTHNLWVEDDKLYVAYYEGGVRVVDVSGELLGDLHDQDREIAVYKAFDPNGYVPNAAMAWGPQPHKGNLFFSDFNSGLWSIKLLPRGRPIS